MKTLKSKKTINCMEVLTKSELMQVKGGDDPQLDSAIKALENDMETVKNKRQEW